MMRKGFDFFVLFLYCGFIFWLSSQSKLPTPDLFENEDKLHHYIAYFLMGLFAWRAFRHLGLRVHVLLLVSLGFCSVYGLSDEWHQSFVVGRNTSALDWLADTIGGLTASLTGYWYIRQTRKA
jgi:VanZ family protein